MFAVAWAYGLDDARGLKHGAYALGLTWFLCIALSPAFLPGSHKLAIFPRLLGHPKQLGFLKSSS